MSDIVLDISSDRSKIFLLSRWSTDINLALTKKEEIIVADIPSRKVMCGTRRDLLTPGSALNVFYVEKAGGSSVHNLLLFPHTLLVTHRSPALRLPNPCLYKSDISFKGISPQLYRWANKISAPDLNELISWIYRRPSRNTAYVVTATIAKHPDLTFSLRQYGKTYHGRT